MLEFDIRSRYGSFDLDVSASLPAAGVTAIYGASGAGKSSLLNCLAGFSKPLHGSEIKFSGRHWLTRAGESLPIHQRGVGYVTQETALFTHLNSADNLAFAEKRQFTTPTYSRAMLVDTLGLEPLLQKFPQQLSGGERQRVAIARALISGPSLLLLDEPINALDHDAREDVLSFLEHLRQQLSVPVLLVTHHQEELMRLADRVLLLDQGKLCGDYTTGELLATLDSPIPGHHERGVIIESTISAIDPHYHLACIAVDKSIDSKHKQLWFTCQRAAVGDRVRLRIYARDISLALSPPSDSSIINCVAATVEAITLGADARAMVKLRCGEHALIAKLTQKSVTELPVEEGQQLYAQIKGVALLGLDSSWQYNSGTGDPSVR